MFVYDVSPRIQGILNTVKEFSATEKLVLAKLLLDSLVDGTAEEKVDWQNLGLAAFQQEWDNSEDAIYDHWQQLYGISTR